MQCVFEINNSLGKSFYLGCYKKENDLLLREIAIRLRGNEPCFIKCKKKPKEPIKLYEDFMKQLENEAAKNPADIAGKLRENK